jgi:hypothetical protein
VPDRPGGSVVCKGALFWLCADRLAAHWRSRQGSQPCHILEAFVVLWEQYEAAALNKEDPGNLLLQASIQTAFLALQLGSLSFHNGGSLCALHDMQNCCGM